MSVDKLSHNIWMSSGEYSHEMSYWLNKLQGEFDMGTLPIDYNKGEAYRYVKGMVKYSFSNELFNKIHSVSKGSVHGIYMILLSGVFYILYKYSGDCDMVLGMPILKQEQQDRYSNSMVAIRGQVDASKSFKDFLIEIKETVMEADKNQNIPFDILAEHLDIRPEAPRLSTFNTVVLMDTLHEAECIEEMDFPAKFVFSKGCDSIEVTIEYNAVMYKEETIRMMGGHLENFYMHAMKNPEGLLVEKDILSEQEYRQILFDFNNTMTGYPGDMTIHKLFENQVDRAPGEKAVIMGEQALCYGELEERANRLAACLNEEHGIHVGSMIGVMMEPSFEQITAILGILKAGGAYIPIDPVYPQERIKTVINDAQIGVVISSREHIGILNRLQWECESFKAYICMDSEDVYSEEEQEKNGLMDDKVWGYVVSEASNDIEGGAWFDSYTGESLSRMDMDEYSDNILKKLRPYLHENVRVLEIGCSSGISMFKIAPYTALYYGTDMTGAIIDKDRRIIEARGIKNIRLACLPAHEIDRLDEKNFDIVIMNSVVQCFHGHNYFRQVLSKAMGLMSEKGILFIGDVMDQDLKNELVQSTLEFKVKNSQSIYRTKTDWSSELFLSKDYFRDLSIDMGQIKEVRFTEKIHTVENELTRFRYDALLEIDKSLAEGFVKGKKNKYQLDLKALKKYSGSRIGSGAKPDDPAYVIYTSGTTGKPKGVVITHRNVVRLFFNDNMQFDFGPDDVWTMFHSYCFDFSVWEMYGALLYGGRLVLVPRHTAKDSGEFLTLLKKERVTVLNQTPTAFYSLMEQELKFPANDLALRYVIFGGEALKTGRLKGWKEKYPGVKLVNMYGVTETTVHVTYKEITECEIECDSKSIGRPIPTLSAYVMDRNMRLTPIGGVGELCIGGAGVAMGYLNRPELTEKKFVQNSYRPEERIYRSGDLVKLLPDGELMYMGRIDHQVKIRGHRIELAEIEVRLIKNPLIKEVLVTVREDNNDEDKYICAYYVSEEELAVPELRAYLLKELPLYMVPSYFVRLEKIPLTVNGKINRKALPDPGKNINTGVEYISPRNKIEEELAYIWKEVLRVERVGMKDNFFDLGGNSIKAVQSALRASLDGIKISTRDILKFPTIAELVEIVKYEAVEAIEDEVPEEEKILY